MTEIDKILITSSLTVLGGLIVFVFGQLLAKSIIEPIHDLKKTIGEISFALAFHAPAIHTPIGKKEPEDKAREALRKLSCDLRSKIRVIPVYGFWSAFFCSLPSRKNVLSAATHLMGLSNSVHKEDRSRNADIENKINILLNLEPVE